MAPSDRVLTTTEVAAQLGVDRRYVWRLIKEQRLMAVRAGRDWLIRPDALERFERQRRRVGRPRTGAADTNAGS